MIYRFRIILDNDTEDDIFRDIEIRKSDTLEDLHNAITQAFGFDGSEMASFYLSDDDWNQGEEISLFNLGDDLNTSRLMNETKLEDEFNEDKTKMIYIYDFLNIWTFFVELGEIVDEAKGSDYPNLMYVHGQIPNEAPVRYFESGVEDDSLNEFEDGMDVDNYESMDFDENWN